MKRLISTMTAAGLLAGALLLPAMIRAEDKKEDKAEAHEKEGRAAHWREKLGISEEQEGKLKGIKRAHREAEEGARAEMAATMRKLEDQLEDKASDKDLTVTLDKLQAQHKSISAEREKFMGAMAQVLTPTQRAKMAVAMGKHMHGGMMGHGRGGKPGHEKKGGPAGEKEDGPEHEDD